MSALAPGPGDLGGRLPAEDPCWVCGNDRGAEPGDLCPECDERLAGVGQAELLAEVYALESTLSRVDAERWQARRQRDEALARLAEVGR